LSNLPSLSEANIIQRYNRPWLFYFLATVGSWGAWLLAAWISRADDASSILPSALVTILLLLGLLAPFFSSWALIRKDAILREDLSLRLRRFGRTEWRYALFGAGLMLSSILLAQLISLLFGYSAEQFKFNFSASFSAGLVSGWMALIFAPLLEEISWHSYGTDTIRRRFNLFVTSVIFAAYWVLWHAPLGLIENYYQANVIESGALYTVNMIVSIFPFVLIMNWCYFKSNRSIIVAIIFHLAAGAFNEIFNTHPMSKVIQTGLLLLVCVFLIRHDPQFFFNREITSINRKQ